MLKYLYLSLISFLFISCSKDSPESGESDKDTIAPKVEFSIAGFPKTSTSNEPIIVSNYIEINIDATDNNGIAKIEAFINEEKVGEDSTAPYQITIDISSYTSKTENTNKFKDYNLVVSATDNSGNITSQEQIIHIDNEIPVISNVSLNANAAINGAENKITFFVQDNKELTSIKTFVNNNLISEIVDGNYEVLINTLQLPDGENIFKIEAIDAANNMAVYEVNFISDNTGPEITSESIVEGSILDTLILFQPKVEDLFSEVTSFKVYLNDELLHESLDSGQKTIEIDANTLGIGDAIFKLIATDDLNNKTTVQINAIIQRRLFTVEIEDGFLESSWRSFWILVSEMNGSPIVYHLAQLNEEKIVLHAPTEFPIDKEFMVSFIADEDHLSWIDTHMTTIQNLTRKNFNSIHFTPPFGSTYSVKNVSAINFEATDDTQAQGRNFQIYHESSQQAIRVVQYQGHEQYFPNNAYLIGYQLLENTPYSYLKVDNPWNTDFTVNKDDFTNNLVNTGVVDLGNIVGAYNPSLKILGYETDEDFENNAYHQIYMNAGQQEYGNQFSYYYPDIFSRYKHHFRVKNYNTIREGKPLSSYNIPDWLPNFTQNNSEIITNNSGTGHSVGRFFLTYGKPEGGYQSFNLIYDSSKNQTLHVPQLPEAMSNLSIYEAFKNELFEVDFADLSSFDNIQTYDDYLNQVIKPYKEHYETSKITDNIVDGNLFAILSNWSFKYD